MKINSTQCHHTSQRSGADWLQSMARTAYCPIATWSREATLAAPLRRPWVVSMLAHSEFQGPLTQDRNLFGTLSASASANASANASIELVHMRVVCYVLGFLHAELSSRTVRAGPTGDGRRSWSYWIEGSEQAQSRCRANFKPAVNAVPERPTRTDPHPSRHSDPSGLFGTGMFAGGGRVVNPTRRNMEKSFPRGVRLKETKPHWLMGSRLKEEKGCPARAPQA
ncbi:hypothetical protein GGTG_14294 [Gaeumannomyces tritici R3-111a-1]|uniref:Uncharacterized protein n=1 Tax=Gaeumannomyces tritici (strain R3-111a-1) TaxID=644352 RepID=J3PL49_GAET3|nr:hypothetical protein GGTG_14294 [Gaeumannomyces tritici R3-111a-1]EJT68127.1 hypothetical protein GGTG_14294 [Gaeumannomyces tritici R3-111a-1]